MASFDNEHTRSFSIALAAATVAWFFQPEAHAATPQILGLVATAEPTELKCADGVCSAAFSSFCLQQDKPIPEAGTTYRAAAGSPLMLVYTDESGAAHEIDASTFVSIDSERRFASVRISVPETARDALGAATLALRVGDHASAVPAEAADDPSTLMMAEIHRYTATLRQLADWLFDRTSDTAVAAATALRLANAAERAAPETPIDVAALWHATLGEVPSPEAAPGIAAVARELEGCVTQAGGGLTGSGASACLQTIHEVHIARANVRVWTGLQAGS